MKLAKFFINFSYLGGCVAVFLRAQDIPWWNIVGALSFATFIIAGTTWYSINLNSEDTFIKHERMNPVIVFFKALLVIVGILGFIYSFTTRGTLFCPALEVPRIGFIIVGCIIEFVVFLAYLYTFTSELKEEYKEIAV